MQDPADFGKLIRSAPAGATIRLENRIGETVRLAHFLEDFGRFTGLSRRVVLDLNLAAEELFVNVVRYGFQDGGRHHVDVEVWTNQEALKLRMVDQGAPFDPGAARVPDPDAPLEARPIGGLGIYLARAKVDAIDYRRHDGRNQVTITKRLAVMTAAPDATAPRGNNG